MVWLKIEAAVRISRFVISPKWTLQTAILTPRKADNRNIDHDMMCLSNLHDNCEPGIVPLAFPCPRSGGHGSG